MKRIFSWDKKYFLWGVTAFCVIACSIIFYMALNYIGLIRTGLAGLIKILTPFIVGLVISYLLSPLVKALQTNGLDNFCSRIYRKRPAKAKRLSRSLSVLISEIIMLALIAALVYLIIPQLYSSIELIILNSPTYIDNISRWIEKVFADYPDIEQFISNLLGDGSENIIAWLKDTVLPNFANLLSNVGNGVFVFAKFILNFIIGIIVSVYLLSNSEGFIAAAKRMLYSVFSVNGTRKLLDGLRFTDKTFIGFINGKLLDSAIIGLICYIVCAILKMPYALLVSVIVGGTNIVPFFGPFIGAVPSSIIILMVDPMKCFIFVIFVVILQQIDGNIIGPKILGSSIGINGFWVMFAIIVGAGLFGFWGMLLGVPVFVVIYTLINDCVLKKLQKNHLPTDEADYLNLDYIDPISYQPVKKIDTVPGDESEK